MSVVSFTDYVPSPRFDNIPWTTVRIYESPAESGAAWTQIDSIALFPVDTDPAHPAARSFTTDNATLLEGWYRVDFVDASGDVLPTEPVKNTPRLDAEYLPTLGQVAAVTIGRTLDQFGKKTGTFTTETDPTDQQVRNLILQAGDDVRDKIGGVIPADLREKAQRVIALRTAMLIELANYSSEVATDRSPYRMIKELYDELLPDLVRAVADEESGANVDDSLTGPGKMAEFGFDSESTWMTRRM